MQNRQLRALVLDPDPRLAAAWPTYGRASGASIDTARQPGELAAAAAAGGRYDLIIVDSNFGPTDGDFVDAVRTASLLLRDGAHGICFVDPDDGARWRAASAAGLRILAKPVDAMTVEVAFAHAYQRRFPSQESRT
jgi:DNA-binding response OmpR family regulator